MEESIYLHIFLHLQPTSLLAQGEVDPDVEVRRFAVLQVEAEVAFVVARLEHVDVAAETDDELRAVVARDIRQVEIILEARAGEPHPGDAISTFLSEIQSLAV